MIGRILRFGLALIVSLAFGGPLLAEEDPASPAAPSSQAPVAPAPAPVASKTAPAAPAPQVVWIEDELPANAKPSGNWIWDSSSAASGTKSHGHPSVKGLQSHGFVGNEVSLTANGMITQQVWLDPKDPPKGIMLKFSLATGEEVGVYWEGEEEVFTPAADEEVWYYGLLPELGSWTTLEVLAEDLGLEGEKINGLSFVTFDGRALWDKTSVTKAPPVAEIGSAPEEGQTADVIPAKAGI